MNVISLQYTKPIIFIWYDINHYHQPGLHDALWTSIAHQFFGKHKQQQWVMSTTLQLHHNFNICIYIMKISIMDGFNKCQTNTYYSQRTYEYSKQGLLQRFMDTYYTLNKGCSRWLRLLVIRVILYACKHLKWKFLDDFKHFSW